MDCKANIVAKGHEEYSDHQKYKSSDESTTLMDYISEYMARVFR